MNSITCDHPSSAVFNYRYKGQVVKFCLACLFEKSGIAPYGNSADPFLLRGESSPYETKQKKSKE